MKFNYTEEMTKELLHGNGEYEEWHEYIVDMLPEYDIDTEDRVAGFIAQCAHESNNFRVIKENLNYSAKALDAIFPKYFKRAGRDAQQYHRQPEKIANVIYANRMNNGDTASGDGWKFRGRGIIQLTGRYNYTQFAKSINSGLRATVEYLSTKKGALESACWYWSTNGLNKHADNQDILMMTKRINGGTIGLEDRKKHYAHALEVLGGKWSPPKVKHTTVRKGSKGATVKAVQKALGISADGDFGPGTETAVKDWQRRHGLIADGIVGPATLKEMGIE
tara:strand:+ start:334 stop:1167 length:834 start_codon:yes stop_codon:yes gene_type:complete